MITWFGAFLLVVCFIYFFYFFKIIPRTSEVLEISQSLTNVFFDPKILDIEKEKVFKKNSFKLLFLFVYLFVSSLMVIGLPLGVIYGFELLGFWDTESIIATTLSWQFILINIVFFSIFFALKPRGSTSETQRYSAIERLLYRIAFATPDLQITLSEFEDSFYDTQIKPKNIDRPVFVTGLPRSGTTILLEIIVSTKEFCSHTYRNMPFVLIPLIWQRFYNIFFKKTAVRERDHGDGILIDSGSPEAFEEMIWRPFWKNQYKKGHIEIWNEELRENFEQFFGRHICKIIITGKKYKHDNARYISKNNQNIARIPYIKSIFPDSIILVPFRESGLHALSLLNQHLNFTKIHSEDKFTAEYMEGIGHFDFGKNHKAINFNNSAINSHDEPTSIVYWIRYWIASYSYLLKLPKTDLHFVSYDNLCANPKSSLNKIAMLLDMQQVSELLKQSDKLKVNNKDKPQLKDVPEDLIEQCSYIYRSLQNRSIV